MNPNSNNTEQLIREALTAQADRAVDARTVLAGLNSGPPPRRHTVAWVAAAAVAVVVAVVAVVVTPQLRDRADTATPATVVPTQQTVLLVGLDDAHHADSIMLAHLGANNTAAAVSLPRDAWVSIPGHGKGRLNSAYGLGRADALDKGADPAAAARAGARTTATAVSGLTGAPVDHYAVVPMSRFAELSTAVGGVEVCLNAAVDEPLSGASFDAGRQTVSGQSALAFLRQRHGLLEGDFDRMARLQAFLRSLANELTDGSALADERGREAMLATARDIAHLDQDWDLLGLFEQLRDLRVRDLRMDTIPVVSPSFQTPDGLAVKVDPDQVGAFVQDLFAGSGASGDAPGPSGRDGSSAVVPCVD